MSDLIPVRLLVRYALYNENEVAGLPPGVAAQLIAQGRAEAYDNGTPVAQGTDDTNDPPPPNDAEVAGGGDAGEGEGEGDGGGEGEKAPTGEGTTPPADKTPKPKGKK